MTDEELYTFYKQQLLDDCVPFWLNNSLDHQHGGYLTLLRQDGSPYGYNKYVWPQARAAYMFAKLYNTVEKKADWLEASRLGVTFLQAHALDEKGRAFYQLTRQGTPIYARPFEIFTESFVVLAWAEYARAAGDEGLLAQAEALYWRIIDLLQSDALDQYTYTHTALYKEHAPAMIMINTTQELRDIREDPRYNELIGNWVEDELYLFARDGEQALFERVQPDGQPLLSEPPGRSITPGHSLESCWFCLREGLYRGDQRLIARSVQIVEWTMNLGWDSEHGGIFNFVDCRGEPPGHHDEDWGEDQDWDAKLFWVHAEALYALLLATRCTGRKNLHDWYHKVHDWSFDHFPDKEFGEWFGYLRRDGSVSQTLKGGVKGFFHIPRAFLNCMLQLQGT